MHNIFGFSLIEFNLTLRRFSNKAVEVNPVAVLVVMATFESVVLIIASNIIFDLVTFTTESLVISFKSLGSI